MRTATYGDLKVGAVLLDVKGNVIKIIDYIGGGIWSADNKIVVFAVDVQRYKVA